MAKKKGLYSKKLKDVNKDGKKNFKDTWLGDLIGADGKAGVQGPGMKESLKGARRNGDEKKKSSATKKKSSSKKEAPVAKSASSPKVTVSELDKLSGGRGDGRKEADRRRLDKVLSGAEKAIKKSSNPNDMTAANKKMQEELAAKKSKPSYSDRGNTPIERARSTKAGGKEVKEYSKTEWQSMSAPDKQAARKKYQVRVSAGYSKGGMVSGKPRKGHTDLRKKGMFK